MSRSSFLGGVLAFFYALLLYVIVSASIGAPVPPTIALLMSPFIVLFPAVPGPQIMLAVFVLMIVEYLFWYLVATAALTSSIETTRESLTGTGFGTVSPSTIPFVARAALTATPVPVGCPLPPPAPALFAQRLPTTNVIELFARGSAMGFNAGWNLGLWAMLPFVFAGLLTLLAFIATTIGTAIATILALLGPIGALIILIFGALAAVVGVIVGILVAIVGPILAFVGAILAAILATAAAVVVAVLAVIAPILLALLGPAGPIVLAFLAGLGPLGVIGLLLAVINFLAVIPVISVSRLYQTILGWSSWLMPMSWLATLMGFLLFIASLITAPFFPGGIAVRFDGTTGTIETAGGLAGSTGFSGGFNLANFTFIGTVGGGGAFTCPSISSHETGHTLNVAAFGAIWHLLGNAIEENIAPMFRFRFAYGELNAEGHRPRAGMLFVSIWS